MKEKRENLKYNGTPKQRNDYWL